MNKKIESGQYLRLQFAIESITCVSPYLQQLSMSKDIFKNSEKLNRHNIFKHWNEGKGSDVSYFYWHRPLRIDSDEDTYDALYNDIAQLTASAFAIEVKDQAVEVVSIYLGPIPECARNEKYHEIFGVIGYKINNKNTVYTKLFNN